MKVKVTKENVLITECDAVNESEVNVNLCDFLLPECFQGLTVTAMFNNIPVPLTGTQCYIPSLKNGTAVLGVYAYKESDTGELTLMYSPKPACFYVNKGSYSEKVNVETIPSISEFERYCATISALTFPKSDVINEVDLDGTVANSQVYSASAMNSALTEVGEFLETCEKDIEGLDEGAEKLLNKVTAVSEASTDIQYPSAAAVFKGLCSQSEKTEQVKTELAADIDELAKSLEFSGSKLKTDIIAVDNRVVEIADVIDSVLTEQGAVNESISLLQSDISRIQERADELSDGILNNNGDITQLREQAENIQMDISGLSASVNDIREMVNSHVTDNANSIKGTREGSGFIELDDVSPLAHYLDVAVSGDGAFDSVIECRGKNLLTFEGRTLADFDTSGHRFTGNNIFLSMSGSGYYKKNTGSWEYDEKTHTYTVPCVNAWYGPAIDFKVNAGEVYVASSENISQNFELQTSFYDGSGKHIAYSACADKKSFTVPEGAEWMLVIFVGKVKGAVGEFTCSQLERGSVATDYEEGVAVQRATPDTSGKIATFRSIYPSVVISSHNPDVSIGCTYNRDTQKAYASLVNAILSLGGSV